MKKNLRRLIALALVAAIAAWFLTAPKRADPDIIAGIAPDLALGEQTFIAGGCSACHAVEGADDRLVLSGGMGFDSPFGIFYAPNISPSEQGIGGWSALDLINAMQHGTSPKGAHYYPAFPYTTYQNADPAEIVSLHAYLQTLPQDATPSRAHDVGFPFNIRRSLGGWKLLFMRAGWTIDPGDLTDEETRGRYLAEALGHCSECHTPRNILGGPQRSKWLSGAPNPSGKGEIPNITPGGLDWSEGEILEYLTSGFTPDFDTVGGHMTAVVENLAQLPASDRAAIAAYLKRVPAQP
ncbi:MAG: c-type cytochrome [Paracoccaceae bacterium]